MVRCALYVNSLSFLLSIPLKVSELCPGQDEDGRPGIRTDGQSDDYMLSLRGT